MDSTRMPPGFRFHPTDEELLIHYLRPKSNGQALKFDIIREVDIYKCEPWDLPEKSLLGGSGTEWYFFVTLDKKYPRGGRSNRSTKCGFWKTTGKDRPVRSHSKKVGMKKTLVFCEGRAPHGKTTDWVMYEYRLEDDISKKMRQDAVVLCHVSKRKKSSSIDTESGTDHDNDDVPLTEWDAMVDELLDVPLITESAPTSTVSDGFSAFANQLEQRVKDLSAVCEDANMDSITTDLETQLTNYKPEIAFQLHREYPLPVDTSKLMGEPEGTDVFVHNDEKLIKELYDSCLNGIPPATEAIEDNASEAKSIEDLLLLTQQPGKAIGFEDIPNASLIESTDEFLAKDPLDLGDVVDLQEHLCWLPELGETHSPVSWSLQSTVEDSTEVETTNQLHRRNFQSAPSFLGSPLTDAAPFTHSAPLYLGSPLTNAAPFTHTTLPTNGSSSQPIIPSKAMPLFTFSKLLDAISVLPSSAAVVPPIFNVSMPQKPAHQVTFPCLN